MVPFDYVEEVKTYLVTSPLVHSFDIVEEWCQVDRGYLRIRIILFNGDFVESAEYFVLVRQVCLPERYSHQWMDSTRTRLRKRWDNVPHHQGLENFPHHIHMPDGQIVSGAPVNIIAMLEVIACEIGD